MLRFGIEFTSSIEYKISNASEPITLESTRQLANEFNSVTSETNLRIQQHNTRLKNATKELEKLKQEFWQLMRWDYDQTISRHASQLQLFQKERHESSSRLLDGKQKIARNKNAIVEIQKTTVNIEEAVNNINERLNHLGIYDFYIQKYSENLYRIVREKGSNEVFSSLSEGEKMIISFLYYCEMCKGKLSPTETLHKRVAVIDDPISSLSHIFVFNIGQLIKSEFFNSDNFSQVFVLTHSLYFFYELTDIKAERRHENQKLFRITKNTLGSRLQSMKYEELQNDYHAYWSIVNDKDQPPAIIANCMRNIIEHFFGFVRKNAFNVVQKLMCFEENKYQAFFRYMNRESHSLGQNIFDIKEFDYDIFRDGLRLIFEKTGYPEHYQQMAKIIPR